MVRRSVLFFFHLILSAVVAVSQNSSSTNHPMQDMPGMQGMSDSAKPATSRNSAPDSDQGMALAMHSMESHHLDMGPHMKMTALRPVQPGDEQRAQAVVEAARKAADRYKDYRVAL